MKDWSKRVPDQQTLETGINRVLNSEASSTSLVEVVHRQANAYASTFPSEIVTCHRAGRDDIELFCKYHCDRKKNHINELRGGVAYEALVYQKVLQGSNSSTPYFYGSYTEHGSSRDWLVLDWVEPCVRLDIDAAWRESILSAARWLAAFHREQHEKRDCADYQFLRVYDDDYYRRWSEYSLGFADRKKLYQREVRSICECFNRVVIPLLSSMSATVIHGEFYPQNILICEGVVYPCDWESAAVAPGEIDLASLTRSWSGDLRQELASEYAAHRWSDQVPEQFEQRLQAAAFYQGMLHLSYSSTWKDNGPQLAKSIRRMSALVDRWSNPVCQL